MKTHNKKIIFLLSFIMILNILAPILNFADNINHKKIYDEAYDVLKEDSSNLETNTMQDSINIEQKKQILNDGNEELIVDDDIVQNDILNIELIPKKIDSILKAPIIPFSVYNVVSTVIIKGIEMELLNNKTIGVNKENTAHALMKSGRYDNILDETIFGIAGNFFLTGFTSVDITGHTHGNVLTKNLYNNANFGSDFTNEFSYIQEKLSGQNSGLVKTNDAVVVFGEDFKISHQSNLWKINDKDITAPQYSDNSYNIWQDNKSKFIDLDLLQKDMKSLSSKFSYLKSTDNIRFVTDQNELNSIKMNGVKTAIVLPNKTDDFYVYNTDVNNLWKDKIGISEFNKTQQTFILNIDALGESTINLPSIVYKYNGKISANEETNTPSGGNVIVNVYDSNSNDRMFRGNIKTGYENNIFLISPYSNVKISNQFNGIVIAENIKNSGTEIHRDKPTSPPEPPTPDIPNKEYTSISVTKVWEVEDIDSIKDLEVTVKLLENGIFNGKTIILNKNNSWTNSFKDLDLLDEKGEEIKYDIEEISIPGFNSSINKNTNNDFTLTNTEISEPEEFIEMSIKKTWKNSIGNIISDIFDKNNNKITDISIEIINKDTLEIIRTVTLSQKNNWSIKIKDLPKFKNDGTTLIDYIVSEKSEIDGFKLNIINKHNFDFEVVNIQKQPKEFLDIPVTKIWKVKDIDSIKDLEVTVKLLENGIFNGKTIILNKNNSWTNSFKDLDLLDEKDNEIKYDVEEISIPGFNKGKGGNQTHGFTLINAENPVEPPVPVEPDKPKEFLDIPVTKIWKVKDIDSIKDLEVTVKLLENGIFNGKTIILNKNNSWTNSFKDLDLLDEKDNEIKYDVEEVSIPGFNKGKGGNQTHGFTLINAENPVEPPVPVDPNKPKELLDIPVTKIWKVKDIDSIKDLEVTVKLLENGIFNGKTIILNKNNSWTNSFKDLDLLDEKDNEIKYDVEEISIPGFNKGKGGNQTHGFTLINAENPVEPPIPVDPNKPKELLDIPVTKIWKVKDIDSIKDLEVTVKLLENGIFNGKTIILNKNNSWTNSFKDLDLLDEKDNEIKYDVEEISIPGFNKGKGGNQTHGFTLINAENPVEPPVPVDPNKPKELLDIPVTKIWRDGSNNVTNSNKTITIRLFADDIEIDKIELHNPNWKYTFKNLPKFKNDGKSLIKYTIREDSINGYKKDIVGNSENGFTITNKEIPNTPTRPTKPREPKDPNEPTQPNEPNKPNEPEDFEKSQPEYIDIPVNKYWIGEPLDYITINLLKNGMKIDSIILNKENDWKHIFKNLPLIDSENFEMIEYTVEEIPIQGYTSNVVGDQENGFNITNTIIEPVNELINYDIPSTPEKPKTDNPQTYKDGISKVLAKILIIFGIIVFLDTKRRKISK